MLKISPSIHSIGSLIIIGSAIGVAIPQLATIVYPFIYYALSGMFFISVLSMDRESNKDLLCGKSLKKLLAMCAIKLIAIPLCLFYAIATILNFLGIKSATLALGIAFRFFAAPTFGTPSYVKSYKGNYNRSFLLTLISNLTSIISIPLLICFLVDTPLDIGYFFIMMTEVFLIIIPPLILGILCKKHAPTLAKKIDNNEPFIIKLLCLITTIGSVAGVREKLSQDPFLIIIVSISAITIYIMLTLFGWSIESNNKKDKVCSSMFYSVCAASPVVFAHIFFKDNSTIYVSVAVVNFFQFIPFSMLSTSTFGKPLKI